MHESIIWSGFDMDRIELLGKHIRIIQMKDEPGYAGKEGVVESIDGIGQLHGTWGSLAIIPEEDTFEILEVE